jgi:hypothetical protein
MRTGTNSRPVDNRRTPKENKVTALRPFFLPTMKAKGDNRRGIKVAANRKYDSAICPIPSLSYS